MSFLSRLMSLLLNLFGVTSSPQLLTAAQAIVIEATEAWLRNLKEVGIQDGARFIADARELSKQINADDVSGTEKLKRYLGSVDNLAMLLGGNVTHTLWESVRRTAAELMHQADAAQGSTR